MKKVVFAFGRYNPPTVGHAELITYTVRLAQKNGAEHRIYTSQSHDPSKNPLAPKQKMAFLRQIFPGVNFVDDPAMKTAFAICRKLADEGYEDVTFVVGDDRVSEFRASFSKYIKPKTAKDFNPKIHYPFKKFQVVSSGSRKQGISGTALRAAVRKGDFATFAKASAARDKTLAKKIFTATKKNLAEEYVDEASQREVVKLLSTRGWKLHRRGTNHDIYSHEKGSRHITVPRHGGELDRRLSKEIDKQTVRYIREEMSRKDFSNHLNSFIDFCCDKLSIKDKPTLKFKEPADQGEQPSFAAYAPGAREVYVMSKNRHPMDIFRSVAHELVHHKQNEDGRIGKDIAKEGATGSDIENEANSRAGELMRWYGKANPAAFSMSYVTENKAIVLAGVPGSGKDKILKETILPFGFSEISSETYTTPSDRLIVVNGTSNYERIRFIKEDLEKAGYETIMVFVNTSNDVSRQRNEARAEKGGRVINEAVRYTKWKNAQDTLDRYDDLFERVFVIQNDLDLNQSQEVIQETHHKLVEMVSEDIRQFALSESDRRFENMLNEMDTGLMPSSRNIIDKRNDNSSSAKDDTVYTKDWRRNNVTTPSPEDRFGAKTPENTTPKVDTQRGAYGATPEVKGTISTFRGVNRTPILETGGAGNWGTSKLADKYKSDTPGQIPGKNLEMGYFQYAKTKAPQVKVFGNLPKQADRVGQTYTSAKNPSFVGDITSDQNAFSIGDPLTNWSAIDRWSMREETRNKFKARYGKLAEQKIKETAAKLRRESIFDAPIGVTPNAGNASDDGRPDINAEFEKMAIMKPRRKLNKKK
jgi:predicted RNA binding protein YcfA (HicA-like mRNA interferase family)